MHTSKVFFILVSLFILTFSVGCSGGAGVDAKKETYRGSAVLSWSAPATYTDGSQLTSANIAEYRVYISTQSGVHSSGRYYSVSAPTTSTYVKNLNLTAGQYFFCVTAVDSSGVESDYSGEVSAVLK